MDLIERGSSMRLASAEISRFKSIQHAFVALGKSFNCICGPNGVGKSNLTQAICFALTLPPHVIQPDADHHANTGNKWNFIFPDQATDLGPTEVSLTIEKVSESGALTANILCASVRKSKQTVEFTWNGRKKTRKAIRHTLKEIGIDPRDVSFLVGQNSVHRLSSLKSPDILRCVMMAAGTSKLHDLCTSAMALLKKWERDKLKVLNNINRLHTALEGVEKQLELYTKRRDLASQINGLQRQLAAEAKHQHELLIDQARTSAAELERDIANMQHRRDQLQQELKLRTQSHISVTKQLQDALDDLQEMLVEKEEELIELEEDLANCKQEHEEIQQRVATLQDDLENLRSAAAQHELSLLSLESRSSSRSKDQVRELQQLLSEKENLERTAAQQQAKLIELLHEQDVVEVKLLRLREVESELDQLSADGCETQQAIAEAENDEARSNANILNRLNCSPLSGLPTVGYIWSLFEFTTEEESMIRAASSILRRFFSIIVVQSVNEARELFQHRGSLKGQVKVWVLEELNQYYDSRPVYSIQETVDPMSLIRFDPGFQPVFNRIFKNTLICLDEAAVLPVLRKYPQLNIATRSGRMTRLGSLSGCDSRSESILREKICHDNLKCKIRSLSEQHRLQSSKLCLLKQSLLELQSVEKLQKELKSSILSMRVDIERKNAQISELGEIFYNANSGDHNVEEFEALSELIITIQDLREQISSVQRDYHDSITEEQNLKSEISSLSDAVNKCKTSAQTSETAIREKRALLDKENARIRSARKAVRTQEQKLFEYDVQISNRQKKLKRARESLNRLIHANVDDDHFAATMINTATEKIREKISCVEAELSKLPTQQSSIPEALLLHANEKRREYDDFVDKMDSLEKAIENLRNSIENSKLTIKRANSQALMSIKEKFAFHFSHMVPSIIAVLKGDGVASNLQFMLQTGNGSTSSVAELSGGQQTLLGISFLLVTKAVSQYRAKPFIILDEIDAALDESNSQVVARSLRQNLLHQQIIAVSHHQDFIREAHREIHVAKRGGHTTVVRAFDRR